MLIRVMDKGMLQGMKPVQSLAAVRTMMQSAALCIFTRSMHSRKVSSLLEAVLLLTVSCRTVGHTRQVNVNQKACLGFEQELAE